MAATLPSALLLKKKAILMGIIKASHWASVMRNSVRRQMRLGTRLYFGLLCPLNKIAQASQAQSIFRRAISTK